MDRPEADLSALRRDLVAAVGVERCSEAADDLAYYGSDRCRGGWRAGRS